MMQDQLSLLERTRYVIGKYAARTDSEDELIMTEMIRFLDRSKAPTQQLDAFLQDLARIVHRLFDFKEVCIGIQDPSDGMFRLRICLGFRGAAQEVRKRTAYSPQELMDEKLYPSTQIGRRTRFYLSENQPFKDSEREAFNRPSLLGKERESIDLMVEGDYIDIFMLDHRMQIIGWLELSNPVNGRWPDKKTIRWLELFVSIAAAVISQRMGARRGNYHIPVVNLV